MKDMKLVKNMKKSILDIKAFLHALHFLHGLHVFRCARSPTLTRVQLI